MSDHRERGRKIDCNVWPWRKTEAACLFFFFARVLEGRASSKRYEMLEDEAAVLKRVESSADMQPSGKCGIIFLLVLLVRLFFSDSLRKYRFCVFK